MYGRISELEKEHKNFRRKIGQIELGAEVNVLTRTIPVEKTMHFYAPKPVKARQWPWFLSLSSNTSSVRLFSNNVSRWVLRSNTRSASIEHGWIPTGVGELSVHVHS